MKTAEADLSTVREAALALPRDSRAQLAEELLESLDTDPDSAAIQTAWVEEAERRLDGILAGRRKTIPGDEVARRVRESLRG